MKSKARNFNVSKKRYMGRRSLKEGDREGKYVLILQDQKHKNNKNINSMEILRRLYRKFEHANKKTWAKDDIVI